MSNWHSWLYKGYQLVRVLILVIILSWLCKSFIISVYYVPSFSMYPTLSGGDYVLATKFAYNLRTPEYYPLTDLPFPYFYIDGVGSVQRGDIMIFDLPLFPQQLHPTQKENYIKRCVGMSGDTIVIIDDRYQLLRADKLTHQDITESGGQLSRIPEKGSLISLVDSTKRIWKSIVHRDGNSLRIDSSGNVYINGKQSRSYRVKQNYYFVEGDNRQHSSDSRSWGLVPKEDLIGKAEMKIWPWPPEVL